MAPVSAQEDRARWNERYANGSGPTRLNERLARYLHLLKRGRALDLAGGIGQNDALLREWQVVLVDISEEALTRASGTPLRVQASGLELPFAAATFDTIVDTYYFEPSLDLAALLTPGGTLFFETYTIADYRYRPEFRHAPRLDPSSISKVFRGFEILHFEETDTGERVFGTILARKIAPPEH
jgi:SAM-dependent methyltransferase